MVSMSPLRKRNCHNGRSEQMTVPSRNAFAPPVATFPRLDLVDKHLPRSRHAIWSDSSHSGPFRLRHVTIMATTSAKTSVANICVRKIR